MNGKLPTCNISSASVSQNFPNPFFNFTIINYVLPQIYSSAKIIIADKSGKVLKQINISGNKGSINFNASTTFSSGIYQYSLIVNEKLIDTKQMILSK